jgi:hypothetical protein
MKPVLESLREVLGSPELLLPDGTWDYAAMIEYFVAAVILCIVITSVFRFIGKLVSR